MVVLFGGIMPVSKSKLFFLASMLSLEVNLISSLNCFNNFFQPLCKFGFKLLNSKNPFIKVFRYTACASVGLKFIHALNNARYSKYIGNNGKEGINNGKEGIVENLIYANPRSYSQFKKECKKACPNCTKEKHLYSQGNHYYKNDQSNCESFKKQFFAQDSSSSKKKCICNGTTLFEKISYLPSTLHLNFVVNIAKFSISLINPVGAVTSFISLFSNVPSRMNNWLVKKQFTCPRRMDNSSLEYPDGVVANTGQFISWVFSNVLFECAAISQKERCYVGIADIEMEKRKLDGIPTTIGDIDFNSCNQYQNQYPDFGNCNYNCSQLVITTHKYNHPVVEKNDIDQSQQIQNLQMYQYPEENCSLQEQSPGNIIQTQLDHESQSKSQVKADKESHFNSLCFAMERLSVNFIDKVNAPANENKIIYPNYNAEEDIKFIETTMSQRQTTLGNDISDELSSTGRFKDTSLSNECLAIMALYNPSFSAYGGNDEIISRIEFLKDFHLKLGKHYEKHVDKAQIAVMHGYSGLFNRSYQNAQDSNVINENMFVFQRAGQNYLGADTDYNNDYKLFYRMLGNMIKKIDPYYNNPELGVNSGAIEQASNFDNENLLDKSFQAEQIKDPSLDRKVFKENFRAISKDGKDLERQKKLLTASKEKEQEKKWNFEGFVAPYELEKARKMTHWYLRRFLTEFFRS
jgi:hypothetical protein